MHQGYQTGSRVDTGVSCARQLVSKRTSPYCKYTVTRPVSSFGICVWGATAAPAAATTTAVTCVLMAPTLPTTSCCSNLFEDLAGLLCKTAFPGGGGKGLGPMHLISLEALLALLGALAER